MMLKEKLLCIKQRQPCLWRISLWLLFMFMSLSSYAQSMGGRVVNAENEGLEGANVVLLDSAKHIISYSIADAEGHFLLNTPPIINRATIKISFVGYKDQLIPMKDAKSDMLVKMVRNKFQLKEVKVKASKIRTIGDTLSYSVAAFKQGQDRKLADVIVKMPGLEVKPNGQIEYQGKAINKFYIEGLDLMGSQYGMANQNISVDKVKSVQVLQNHQPVKSLRGVSFSEQAALNIVLKDDAKDVLGGVVDLGEGYGDKYLYENRLMGMRFGRKNQMLILYKNNNIGVDVSSELNVLTQSSKVLNNQEQENGFLSLMGIEHANIDRERYTFNASHLVAGNWLKKINQTTDLRVQLSSLIDKENLQNEQTTSYLALENAPTVIEEQSVYNTRSQWKGSLTYQMNSLKTFIKNSLRAYADFNKSNGVMNYNGKATNVFVKPRKKSVTNDFSLSRTSSKGHVYELNSLLNYLYFPGKILTVNKGMESLNTSFFSSYNNLIYKIKLGKNNLNNEIGIYHDRQHLSCKLDSVCQENSVPTYRLWQIYYKPSVALYLGDLRLSISSKINYLRHSFHSEKSHMVIDGQLNVNWNWSASSSFSTVVSLWHKPFMIKDIVDLPIFVGYRTTVQNKGDDAMTKQWNMALGYQYTEPIKGLFLNIRPFWNRSEGNVLYGSQLQDGVYSQIASNTTNTITNWGLMWRIAKSFSWAGMFLGFSANCQMRDYHVLVSKQPDKARMASAMFILDYSLRPIRQLSVEGKSELSYSSQKSGSKIGEASECSTANWSHLLNCFVFLTDKLMLSINNQFYHSRDKSLGTSYFCDLAISYKLKRLELSLMGNNIMNTKQLKRRVLTDTMDYYSLTYLRSRNFVIKCSLDI